MPYIRPELRGKYHAPLVELEKALAFDDWAPGSINYVVYSLLLRVMTQQGERYCNYNALMGMLVCVALELYRQNIAPYEDDAEKTNGPV